MVVVFPAPLGPRRPTISFRPTSNEIPSTAIVSWKTRRNRETESTFGVTFTPQSGPVPKVTASQVLCLMKVPFRYSSNAVRISSEVFITMGPYQATGSPIGLPDTRRKRTGSFSAVMETTSPSP